MSLSWLSLQWRDVLICYLFISLSVKTYLIKYDGKEDNGIPYNEFQLFLFNFIKTAHECCWMSLSLGVLDVIYITCSSNSPASHELNQDGQNKKPWMKLAYLSPHVKSPNLHIFCSSPRLLSSHLSHQRRKQSSSRQTGGGEGGLFADLL